jgi:hypothetical protein
MKNIYTYLIVSLLVISFTSCTDDFESINTDPNGITEESLTQMNKNVGNEFDPMFFECVQCYTSMELPITTKSYG